MNGSKSSFQKYVARYLPCLAIAFAILICARYFVHLTSNPAGFHIDESSISYNAYVISQTGRDEHGVKFPLFFQAFGEYKNPIYIYLLSVIFRITGPSMLVARAFSAALVVFAALLLGLLALRLSRRNDVALFILISALLTPWLFELSRVVLEVSIYPLAIAILLINVQRANARKYWMWTDAVAIALSLALLTYAYSIGRLFAPLLALGLFFFIRKAGRKSLARVWAVYVLLLLPMLIFHLRHGDALMKRFYAMTFVSSKLAKSQIVWEFCKHFIGNFNPWAIAVTGDPNQYQIATIYGLGLILVATFFLALLGLFVILRERRRNPWARFVVFGFFASAIPSSLTIDYVHALRLVALPVFTLVLCIPALEWLNEHNTIRAWRYALGAVIILTVVQGLLFQYQYSVYGKTPFRRHLFDVDYHSRILPAALAANSRPIYLADAPPIPVYIQAYWYATLDSIPLSTFKKLGPDAPVPADAIAISTEEILPRCKLLQKIDPYRVCLMDGEPHRPSPLTEMRAELSVNEVPNQFARSDKRLVKIAVRNTSSVTWYAAERAVTPWQINVGNHWLDSAGNIIVHDDGRGALARDVTTGEKLIVSFWVNAPATAGNYVLEFDVLQEDVSWFALKGSKTLRLPVQVK